MALSYVAVGLLLATLLRSAADNEEVAAWKRDLGCFVVGMLWGPLLLIGMLAGAALWTWDRRQ